MRKFPQIWNLKELFRYTLDRETLVLIDDEWQPARTSGYPSLRMRFKAAWLVFTGKADAVRWPGGQ